jgi:hypothetical protein
MPGRAAFAQLDLATGKSSCGCASCLAHENEWSRANPVRGTGRCRTRCCVKNATDAGSPAWRVFSAPHHTPGPTAAEHRCRWRASGRSRHAPGVRATAARGVPWCRSSLWASDLDGTESNAINLQTIEWAVHSPEELFRAVYQLPSRLKEPPCEPADRPENTARKDPATHMAVRAPPSCFTVA